MTDFADLYGADYNLDRVFAMYQHWQENAVFRMSAPRSTSCLLYFKGCKGIYTLSAPDGEKTVTVQNGGVVYIPEGAEYTTRFLDCETDAPTTVLIEFGLKTVEGERFSAGSDIVILTEESDPLTDGLFDEAVSIYTSAVISFARMRSVIYKLLCEFCGRHRQQSIRSREFSIISRGITYMESNINQDMSVEDIAEMCHVSPSCFRRLFRKYSGMSPVEYRTHAKIEYAKKLLSSDVSSISEIAETLCFRDTAYFCRVFRKSTGYTPGEYAGFFK